MYFRIASLGDLFWCIGFLFSLSLTGLGLEWAFILTLLIMTNRFFHRREEFIIELFILSTYSGFVNDHQFPFKWIDILYILSIILLFCYRLDRKIKIILWATATYFVFVFGISMLSPEPMGVQIRLMRYYFGIITFIIPFILLDHEKADYKRVGYIVILYSLVICLFYIIDGFLLNGHVLVPNTSHEGEVGISRWNDLYWAPLSTYFPRKYPSGLYILLFTAYYVGRYYKFKIIFWLILILAIVSSRTMTVTVAIIAVYFISLPQRKKLLNLSLKSIVLFSILYVVDYNTGNFLRVASTANQFFELKEAIETDDLERLAEFGSGRIAQAYPKLELLNERDKIWTGFGFIHPSESRMTDLLIKNPLYSDQSKETSIELPVDVEITQVQTILNIGLIGLFLQIIFYVFLSLFLYRHFVNWKLFVCIIIGASIAGLGGFIGLTNVATPWLGLALGLSLLSDEKNREVNLQNNGVALFCKN